MEQQQPRRRNPWKWIVLMAAGFVVLLVGGCTLIVIGVALSGAGGGGGPAGNAGAGGQPQEERPSEATQAPSEASGATEDYLLVTGTEGIAVSCSIEDDKGGRSVDLRVPDKIKLNAGWGSIVSVVCQKSGASGKLTAAIVIDGNTEAQRSTTAAYGLVDMVYPS
jgi:hypothetical protein